MLKFCIFVCVIVSSYAKSIPFTDCGSVGGKISTLDMSPCDDSVSPYPCVLHRGVNYSMSVNFTAEENCKNLTTKVYGLFPDVKPFEFMVMNSCTHHDIPCPMESGKFYHYTNSIYCRKIYPKVKLGVKWELVDENGKMVFCFVVPTEIMD